jgi:Raf kinase inhibitor-like YbhB/YbcL family protein
MKKITYALLAVTLLVLAGVGSAAAQQGQAPPPSKFKLMSSAFSDGGQIPNNISCADPNAASPALSWSNPPSGVTSFALVMHDTDAAPQKGTMDVTHWILWNIPASSTSVTANVKVDSSPEGIAQGKNVRGVNGYMLKAMDGHVIGKATTAGTFGR